MTNFLPITNKTMDYAKEFNGIRERFESYFAAIFDGKNYPEPLQESMKYSLFTGGKRIRPVLAMQAYKAFAGKIDETALELAAAVELLHTYSLVHDDLPCMDNDDYRRGQLTSHKKFGEDVAVLTGDALLTAAFERFFVAASMAANKERIIKAGYEFARLTGANGLISGQVRDLAFDKKNTHTLNEIEYIFRHKTCDLIIAAVKIGAIAGGADHKSVTAMENYAYNFGFAFQIADDYLDGDDQDGCTILKVVNKDEAKKLIGVYTDRAIKALNETNIDIEFFRELALKAANRTV